jgi:FkbM family methyltransferase
MYGAATSGEPVAVEDGPLRGYRLSPGEHVSHAHIRGTYERDVQEAIARLVRSGDVCLDIGASIGYLTLVMVAAGAKKVYAFEPAPHAAETLRKQMQVNGVNCVEVLGKPVSDQRRIVTFAMTDTAYGSVITHGSTRWPTLELESITLDEFVAQHGIPAFIKIDVEGEEDAVLRGARRLLGERRTRFCIEVHSRQDAEEVIAILNEYGYKITGIDGNPYQIAESVRPGAEHVLGVPR